MPAYLRYRGQLYCHGATAVGRAVAAGRHIMIVSGAYGLLLADEPIGWYEKRFRLSDWPRGLLEDCILDYAHHEQITSVVAVMSRTTDYAKLVRRVNWERSSIAAMLISPVSSGGGSMVKVPRAQGQTIADLFASGVVVDEWRSQDDLGLHAEPV